MSRSRSVSTDISVDEKLARLAEGVDGAAPGAEELLACLLWTWMLPHFDDWGRMPGSPHEVRMTVLACLQLTAAQVSRAVDRLVAVELVRRYEVEGKSYLAVGNLEAWYRRQSYIPRWKREEDKSRYPAPPRAATPRQAPAFPAEPYLPFPSPAVKSPVDEIPEAKIPEGETPVDETPVDEIPAAKTPEVEAPAGETPGSEIPATADPRKTPQRAAEPREGPQRAAKSKNGEGEGEGEGSRLYPRKKLQGKPWPRAASGPRRALSASQQGVRTLEQVFETAGVHPPDPRFLAKLAQLAGSPELAAERLRRLTPGQLAKSLGYLRQVAAESGPPARASPRSGASGGSPIGLDATRRAQLAALGAAGGGGVDRPGE